MGKFELAKLKTELLCYGIRVSEELSFLVPKKYPKGRSRAGVAGSGKTIVLRFNGEETFANVGVLQPFLERSPFELKKEDGKIWIFKKDERICRTLLPEPEWHKTELGDTVQLHGIFTLATMITNKCLFREQNKGCKFCIIDVGGANVFRTPEEISKAVRNVLENPELRTWRSPDGETGEIKPRNFSINSGTINERTAVEIYSRVIKEIKEIADIPIGIEITPISAESMEKLYSAGLDEISFNLEVYSEKARKEVIPGKNAVYPIEKYFEAFKKAIKIFGENQVESWLIIGLEPKEDTIKGINAIAENGAIPLPKPYRPLFGAEFEKIPPPNTEDALEIYEAWKNAVKEFGLDPRKTKAGCGFCGSCFPTKEFLKAK